jgi:phosphate transport system protein
MSKHLQRDLDNLQRDILAQADVVEGAVRKAVHSLLSRDESLARAVIDGDDCIDQEQNRIEEECLKILALHQPVAIDLRRVTAAMMVNVDLERIGDLAEDMAGRTLALMKLPAIPAPARLQAMADASIQMVRQALDAFMHQDVRLARAVCLQDDIVDRYNSEIIQELAKLMGANPDAVEPGLSFFSAVRQLERIADHATNIAEDVIYLAEGEIVRHRPDALGRER